MGFEIEDGVLVKYDGDEEIVKIPEGVKTIYQISFQHVGSRFEQLITPFGFFRYAANLLHPTECSFS